MDYYNVDSEIIEILNILRPPVKRSSSKRDYKIRNDQYIGYVGGDSNNIDLVRDFAQSCTRDIKTYQQTNKELGSSLSLILQKTSKRRIFEKYSYINYEPQQSDQDNINNQQDPFVQNKPVIKVTVIPNPGHKPITKSLKTSNQYTIHSTCSNQDTSVESKNVYLVVAGRKKEKFYEIKTTGSVKLASDINNDFKGLRNDKHLLKSIKMERKKKKTATKEKKPVKENECRCSKPGNGNMRNMITGTSKVEIVGRIGISEDDKYVLQYETTVNDKPVPVKSSVQDMRASYFSDRFKTNSQIPKNDKGTSMEADSFMQTSFENNRFNVSSYMDSSSRRQNFPEWITNRAEQQNELFKQKLRMSCSRQESTGTQVNIKVKIKPQFNDQAVQCKCSETYIHCENYSSSEPITNEVTSPGSPLVIISVYPKQDILSPMPSPAITQQVPVNRMLTQCEKQSETAKKTHIYHRKSRKTLDENEKLNESLKINKKPISTLYKASRPNSPTKKATNMSLKKETSTQNKTVNVNERNPSPTRTKNTASIQNKEQRKDINVSTHETKQLYSSRVEVEKQKNRIPDSRLKTRDKLSNKKAQPKNFTSDRNNKKRMKQNKFAVNSNSAGATNDVMIKTDTKELKRSFPKHEVSKVSVNIDSEREYYDVVFEQGIYTMGLNVRKTMKDVYSPGSYNKDCKSDSLENLFPIENNERNTGQRRSISQAIMDNAIDVALAEPTSRINVRDSIEIGHKREVKDTRETHTKHIFSADNNITNIFASVKHYIGDNCVISDPIKRDKEIRELLGIDKYRIDKNSTDVQQVPLHIPRGVTTNKQGINDSLLIEATLQSLFPRICIQNYESDNPDGNNPLNPCPQRSIQNHKSETSVKINTKQRNIRLSRRQYCKVKKSIRKVSERRYRPKLYWNSSLISVGAVRTKPQLHILVHWDRSIQTDPPMEANDQQNEIKKSEAKDNVEKTIVLFARNNNAPQENLESKVKKTASSVEIQYTTDIIARETACSFMNVDFIEPSSLERQKQESVETLFRGTKKTRTPNLGTSALSLLSEVSANTISGKTSSLTPSAMKPKKPFLKRLMSCLVMHSARVSGVKVPPGKRQPVTGNSSVDSYHISTSLGAIEMSSSLYDTSESFYSNHTIGPVHSKMKRGFFSSVRGFLTATRKS